MCFRFATSYNQRSRISVNTKAWYGMSQIKQYSATPRQLKEDEEHEHKLYNQFQLADVFNPSIHPNDLFNIVSKDLATRAIEESLLSTAAFGRAKMEEFVTQRLIVPEHHLRPPISFSSRLSNSKALTFANLYDEQANNQRLSRWWTWIEIYYRAWLQLMKQNALWI